MWFAALALGPVGAAAAMGLAWVAFGLDDRRGIGDVRVFSLGALVAAGVVAIYAKRRRVSTPSAAGWSLASFVLTLCLLLTALVIAAALIGSPGPAN